MVEYKRIKCPECGNEDPRKLFEQADKTTVLYYSMQGTPVYRKQMKCGNCGNIFDKNNS